MFGRKDFASAEDNLPGHMARREFFELAKLNINGFSQIATQTVVLFRPSVPWCCVSYTSLHTKRCCGWFSLAQHKVRFWACREKFVLVQPQHLRFLLILIRSLKTSTTRSGLQITCTSSK